MLYFRLFDKWYVNRQPSVGVSFPDGLEYLRRRYDSNTAIAKNYYLKKDFAVKNTHIIPRMVEHFPANYSDNTYGFVSTVESRLTYLSKAFQITSYLEKSTLHPSNFYGEGNNEVLLLDNRPISYSHAQSNWKTLTCVRTLMSPVNDANILLPFGKDVGGKKGNSVIGIDMNRLAIKYNMYLKEQAVNQKMGKPVMNKGTFVSKYVIPPMANNDVDFRLLNMVKDTFYGNPIVKAHYKIPTTMATDEYSIKKYVGNTLDIISNRPLEFHDIMRNIHLVFHKDALDLLAYDNLILNENTTWAYVLSRIEYFCFFYDVCKDNSINRQVINDWKRLMTRLYFNGFDKKTSELIYKVKNM